MLKPQGCSAQPALISPLDHLLDRYLGRSGPSQSGGSGLADDHPDHARSGDRHLRSLRGIFLRLYNLETAMPVSRCDHAQKLKSRATFSLESLELPLA